MRIEHQVATPVVGDVVRFSETLTSPAWDRPHLEWASLRFLADAGLVIEEQFGD